MKEIKIDASKTFDIITSRISLVDSLN